MNIYYRFLAYVTNAARSEEGVTAIEYALIAALIAVAIVGSVTGVATAIKTEFGNIATSLTTAP